MPAAPKIHVYRSPPDAFFVNAFILEGDRSLVLIDTQFVLSEARALAATIAALARCVGGGGYGVRAGGDCGLKSD